MNSRPYTIGFLTVLTLVALRVVIGWHFFQEGLSHKNDPKWSSEPFLRQAKGPLAEQYKLRAPGFHQFDQLILVPLPPPRPANVDRVALDDNVGPGKPDAGAAEPERAKAAKGNAKPEDSHTYGPWYKAVVTDWGSLRRRLADHYRFTDAQAANSEDIADRYDAQLAKLLAGYEADIAAHRHELYRNQKLAGDLGAEEIPNQITRLTRRSANPTGEPGNSVSSSPAEWRADVAALETALRLDLLALRSDEQQKLPPPPEEMTDLKKMDTVIAWGLTILGACLVAGLFTRLSAFVLALFLISIIASQPPWMPGTTATYFQGVECVALLMLATSHVGRWGGLDFFIHHLFLRPFR